MEQQDLDFDPPIRHNEWYDGIRGFDNDHEGWYQHTLTYERLSRTELKVVIDYLYDKVDNCERHCRWTYGSNYIKVKFRYERDALLFTLRF